MHGADMHVSLTTARIMPASVGLLFLYCCTYICPGRLMRCDAIDMVYATQPSPAQPRKALTGGVGWVHGTARHGVYIYIYLYVCVYVRMYVCVYIYCVARHI